MMEMSRRTVVLRPSHALTAENFEDFWRSLHGAIHDGETTEILVDLHQVEFIDSAVAVVLGQGAKLAEAHGKRLGCFGGNYQVRMVLEVTGMEQFVTIFGDESEFFGDIAPLMAA
ncbi:STAS domain-containing protein [Picosynechococcus sp. NKBG15041c]|uniref:STAS domain-containing protein n=1 Tax=Picosynechococcus sp. NKBG15041c TaxID=1407650 RepID=UPI0004152D05|nr:STAS domain-containing protein [Picosynechococcus sp. NKBG15041c]